MRTFNATLSLLSVVALAFGNGIFIYSNVHATGLNSLADDAGALLFIGGGIALGVLPWLISLVRWLTSGPGGGVPGFMAIAPLLPVAVFLAIMATSLKSYFEGHFSYFVGLVLLSTLLTPILTLTYNIKDQYWPA